MAHPPVSPSLAMAPPPALCPPCAPDAGFRPTGRVTTPRQDFAPGERSWAFLAEPAAAKSGVVGGVLCPPSPAVQQRFPGIAAVWADPSRQQRLVDGLRERLSTVATSVRRTEAEAHPAAAEGDGDRSSSAACGLFADVAIRRGELVGWYWGELVLADEVMRLPDRQQGRYAATFFVDDDLRTPLLPSDSEPEPEPEPLGPARVTIDASRLRGPLAFANDFRWGKCSRSLCVSSRSSSESGLQTRYTSGATRHPTAGRGLRTLSSSRWPCGCTTPPPPCWSWRKGFR